MFVHSFVIVCDLLKGIKGQGQIDQSFAQQTFSSCSTLHNHYLEMNKTYLIPSSPFIVALSEVPIGYRYTGSIEDGLRQLEVHGLRSHGRRSQRVPYLLTTFERRRRVPKLISFTPQLSFSQRHIRLPPYRLVAQRLVLSQAACNKDQFSARSSHQPD